MKTEKVLCVRRAARFSPNSEERDKAILEAVADRLQRAGHSVETLSEDECSLCDISARVSDNFAAVFSMGRDASNLRALSALEKGNVLFPNPPSALGRASRTFLTELMAKEGVTQPLFVILRSDERGGLPDLRFPLWVKRGAMCAQTAGDVRFVATEADLEATLADFAARGIEEIVISEHVEGDLIKFYGVSGTPFFRYFYPREGEKFSKFGLESHNAATAHHPFSAEELRQSAERVARHSGIAIYGGDAIISPDGKSYIIDFNDWPSFSACREDAAEAIAALYLNRKEE